jgi:ABC-type branched-subunit amino acid transport system ATPase component
MRSTSARALLEQVNLWQLANEPAKNISGGQKKLLNSRALMLDPKIILLDEPTAGVSPLMTAVLGETSIKAARAGIITFAIIEHDMDVIAELCNRSTCWRKTHADLGHVQGKSLPIAK